MLIGTTQQSIDAKGRYIVPSKYRDDLGQVFIVTKGVDKCLFIYPMEEWQRVETEMRARAAADSRSRHFYRNYFASAYDVEIDKQFRVVLPPALREYAGLDKEIVTVGMSSRLEIWDKQRWLDYDAESEQTYEEDADNGPGVFLW